jgi:hypothetical protein
VEGYGLKEMEATLALMVRQARASDAAIIVEFNRRLALESEGKTLEPAVVAAGVAASLADPTNKGPYYLAELDGEANHLRMERLAQRLGLVDSGSLRAR